MQRYVHSHLVLSASNSSYGDMTLQTGYSSACGSLNVRNSCWYICKPGFGYPILTTGQTNRQSLTKWLVTVLKRILMVKDTTSSWCVMRECGLELLQLNWFRAAVRLYNALTQRNSSTARKILRADMQLSSRCDDCWSSHFLSAMNGLTQSYLFKERLLKCEPIDLGRFVVDLRERHLNNWTPYSDIHPRERNNKLSTYKWRILDWNFQWKPFSCNPCNRCGDPSDLLGYGYFLSGWQCQASPTVNPSGWRSKPISSAGVSGGYSRRRGTCDGKSAIHPRNQWVWGSNLARGSQPAKLPLFGGYSLETYYLLKAG